MLVNFGGVCWTKSEPILNKIPTDCRPAGGRTETERSGGQKERGLGGRNFCPPSLSPLLFSPPQFFVPAKLARRQLFFVIIMLPENYYFISYNSALKDFNQLSRSLSALFWLCVNRFYTSISNLRFF